MDELQCSFPAASIPRLAAIFEQNNSLKISRDDLLPSHLAASIILDSITESEWLPVRLAYATVIDSL
ncbi:MULTISPECIES: hypothetical protein [Paraburkholderia]|uniref:hypothetical protein n=1 Tax=Paraburkholderia TaxID=1822464 RepID=UPI001656250A|nr:hypothetical protein [Paraburkholderia podalyriae]